MAAGKKIVIGCGIGCGLLVILAVALAGFSAWWLSDTMEGFNEAVDLREDLEEAHGTAASFRPATDGAVPPARMEAFLAVRDATHPAREQVVAKFGGIPFSEAEARKLEEASVTEKVRAAFRIGGSAFGMVDALGEFFAARNQSLIDQELGLGEYTYIYMLAYHVWLGHPPDDGPGSDSGHLSMNGDHDDDAHWDARTSFGPNIDGRLRRDMRAMLENQLAVVDADGAIDPDWREALAEEVEKLEDGRAELPWLDGLPAALVASFEPYRERLEATYSPITNEFELARNRRQNGFSIQAD